MLPGPRGRRAAPGRRQRHPAHQVGLRVGLLAREQRLDPPEVGLPVERLEHVGHQQQALLGREPVGRMAGPRRGERSRLLRRDDGGHAVPDVAEVARSRSSARRCSPWRAARSPTGSAVTIGVHVHPVREAPLVERHDVVAHEQRAGEHVADQPGVGRDLDAERLLHRADRGGGMDAVAGAADALGEQPRIAGVAAGQDRLHAPEHRGRGPCPGDAAAGDVGIDPQLAADAADGVDRDPGHRQRSPVPAGASACVGRFGSRRVRRQARRPRAAAAASTGAASWAGAASTGVASTTAPTTATPSAVASASRRSIRARRL